MPWHPAPQIGLVFANKRVFYKQRDNHFFPAASYVGSLLLTQLPQSFIEVSVFSLLLYWVRAWPGSLGAWHQGAATCMCRVRCMHPSARGPTR